MCLEYSKNVSPRFVANQCSLDLSKTWLWNGLSRHSSIEESIDNSQLKVRHSCERKNLFCKYLPEGYEQKKHQPNGVKVKILSVLTGYIRYLSLRPELLVSSITLTEKFRKTPKNEFLARNRCSLSLRQIQVYP